VGTIAGDDTVFVGRRQQLTSKKLLEYLNTRIKK